MIRLLTKLEFALAKDRPRRRICLGLTGRYSHAAQRLQKVRGPSLFKCALWPDAHTPTCLPVTGKRSLVRLENLMAEKQWRRDIASF